MATSTQRIHVLVTPEEKQKIANKAANAGVSIGTYFKQAAAAYQSADDDQILDWMIDQMNKSANRSIVAIDETLAFVDASNKRIASYENNAKQR